MFKGIAGALVVTGGYVLALGSIVHLEQQRSLGEGRLASYLRAHDRSIVQRAELAIGRTKQASGVPLLLSRSSDPDAGIRAMAIYGLGLIAAPQCGQAVVRGLNDTSAPAQASALDATDRMETAHTFSSEEERKAAARSISLLGRGDPRVRGRAAVTLEAFSSGRQAANALGALVKSFARERDANVRERVAWALYRGYAAKVPVTTLRSELRDGDDVVRIEAVRAIGKRAQASLAAMLQPLVRDPSWRVQEQTLESLKVLRGGKMTEHLASLPPGLHLPPRAADPFAHVRALPRPARQAKFASPSPQKIITQPKFLVNTLADFTGPMRGIHPRMRIVTTQGNIYVGLYPEWAPLTVENFINLAQGGYYDGNPWFRIVPDFVVQSGDPSANSPGVGYTTVAEENPIAEDSYIIALGLDYTNPPNAHAKRDSAGSEFYITLSPQYHLNRDFSVFGRVIAGWDVLPRLVESDKIVRIERIPDAP